MSDSGTRGSGPGEGDQPGESSRSLIEELRTQAVRLEEQAAELEAFNDELSASEARLQGVIQSALDAIITTDSRNRVLDWNQHAEAIFGWTAAEAVGRHIAELIIPERHREAHRLGVERFLATGETRIMNRRIEIDALRRSGETFPVELAVSATRWGSEVVFTSFIRDISERRRDEQRRAARVEVSRLLSESEPGPAAMYRILGALCDTLGCAMGLYWAIDEDDTHLALADRWIDPSARAAGAGVDTAQAGERDGAGEGETEAGEHVGARETRPRLAPGEGLAGRAWREMDAVWSTNLRADEAPGSIREADRVGAVAALAFPVQLGERVLGVIELFAPEQRSPDEALLATVRSLGTDIGQFLSRRAAEEKLEARNEWQRFLVVVGNTLAAAAPNYEETLEKLATLAVPVLADWCSVYTATEGGDVRRLVMVHTDSAEAGAAEGIALDGNRPTRKHPVVKVIASGEPLLVTTAGEEVLASIAEDERELELLRQMHIVSGMIVPLVARGRSLGAILLISMDPSRVYRQPELESALEFADRAALFLDNARLYRDAQVANETKADFLATMSHELRTPLNAVLGYADLLLQGIPEPISEPVAKYVRRIGFSARHLLQLIEEILTYSRLEAGRESVALEPVEMELIAEEVRSIIEPLASEKSLALRIDVSDVDHPVVTDRRKVRQILLNLLSNAVKFTEKGEIDVTAAVEDSDLVLAVRDTGIGVAREHLERIFEPFWQVEQSNTRTAHGTGLGLSVTRRFVKLLGGTVQAESEPGDGSRFEVRLPLGGEGRKTGELGQSERAGD